MQLIQIPRNRFDAQRGNLFQDITRRLEGIQYQPTDHPQVELEKTYYGVLLKTYRVLLCGCADKTFLYKGEPLMLTIEAFAQWRQDMITKLIRQRPSQDDRLLRINSLLVYHIVNTTIMD